METKQAIVLASFGTADAPARKATLDALAEEVAAAYPDFDVLQAYTSNFVRRRMAADGISAMSVPECLDALATAGYERVVVQPTHLSPGEEYENKLLSLVPDFQYRFEDFLMGNPLFFYQEDDYAVGLQTVMDCFPLETGEQLVLLGHGSPHRHNPVYEQLQALADEKQLPVHIGVIEESDVPDFSMVQKRLEEHMAGCILLAPLLLTGGIHVAEDMAGTTESSWKMRLQALGISVRTCMRGLGTFPEFRKLYLGKLQKLIP